MGARLYTPTLGRFLSPDPVHGGNESTYNYPNDPVNGEDISGLCPQCAVLPVAAAAGPPGWVIGGLILAASALVGVTYCRSSSCSLASARTYTFSAAALRAVPQPSRTARSASRYSHVNYIVYEIYSYAVGKGFGFRSTYKYGISRAGAARPASQLSQCARYYGRSCGYTIRAYARGWFTARSIEAGYFMLYFDTYGKCPPGARLCI